MKYLKNKGKDVEYLYIKPAIHPLFPAWHIIAVFFDKTQKKLLFKLTLPEALDDANEMIKGSLTYVRVYEGE